MRNYFAGLKYNFKNTLILNDFIRFIITINYNKQKKNE